MPKPVKLIESSRGDASQVRWTSRIGQKEQINIWRYLEDSSWRYEKDRVVLGWIEIILLSRTTRVKNGKIETDVLDGRLVEPNKLKKIEIFIPQSIATNDAKNERLTPNDEKIEIGRVEE